MIPPGQGFYHYKDTGSQSTSSSTRRENEELRRRVQELERALEEARREKWSLVSNSSSRHGHQEQSSSLPFLAAAQGQEQQQVDDDNNNINDASSLLSILEEESGVAMPQLAHHHPHEYRELGVPMFVTAVEKSTSVETIEMLRRNHGERNHMELCPLNEEDERRIFKEIEKEFQKTNAECLPIHRVTPNQVSEALLLKEQLGSASGGEHSTGTSSWDRWFRYGKYIVYAFAVVGAILVCCWKINWLFWPWILSVFVSGFLILSDILTFSKFL